MIQLERCNIFHLLNQTELIYKIASKAKNLSNKVSHDKIDGVIKTTDVFKKVMPGFNKILGTGIIKTMKY